MEFIEAAVHKLLPIFAKYTDRMITVLVGIVLPVVVTAFILYWKIRQAEKKKIKVGGKKVYYWTCNKGTGKEILQQIKNKEKLIKYLKGEKTSLKLDKSIKISKSTIGHEKEE